MYESKKNICTAAIYRYKWISRWRVVGGWGFDYYSFEEFVAHSALEGHHLGGVRKGDFCDCCMLNTVFLNWPLFLLNSMSSLRHYLDGKLKIRLSLILRLLAHRDPGSWDCHQIYHYGLIRRRVKPFIMVVSLFSILR